MVKKGDLYVFSYQFLQNSKSCLFVFLIANYTLYESMNPDEAEIIIIDNSVTDSIAMFAH